MDVMIRLACDADVAALADLRRGSAFERFPEREDEGYGERFASWYEQEASRRLNWLAETDGTAVGMMNLVLFERMPRPGPSRPVVAAAFGMTLGGGCEVALHAARVQASAETYMGLVETGVGLIPAGGGSKEMLLRLGNAKRAFDLIGPGKVSESAAHARQLGFLRPGDGLSMNRERLTADAKAAAPACVAGW